jgi:hypothetical protein
MYSVSNGLSASSWQITWYGAADQVYSILFCCVGQRCARLAIRHSFTVVGKVLDAIRGVEAFLSNMSIDALWA